MANQKSPYCSHEFSQVLLASLQEIIGETDLTAAFYVATSPNSQGKTQSYLEAGSSLTLAEIIQLFQALEQLYGQKGGQGIALRSGQATFKYLLQRFGKEMKFGELEFRLLPTSQRIKTGLITLAEILSSQCDLLIQVTENSDSWVWRIDQYPEFLATHFKETSCGCYFVIGLLQEFFSWVNGGRYYSVNEVECLATGGAACVFQISQAPLD